MGRYQNFLKLYSDYSEELLFGKVSIRPAKSITRNIVTGVTPFSNYYKSNKKTKYFDSEVSEKILKLDTCQVTSTTRDNIRNMVELRFMIYKDGVCKLTRNFIDFVNQGLSVKEYVLIELKKISSLSDITMFYNCILCVLRDGLINNEIIKYPDSLVKFMNKVKNKSERDVLCEKVYRTYGFHGHNAEFGYYTPNANYRVISTCVELKLIKSNGTDRYGFPRYTIAPDGYALLDIIEKNIKYYQDKVIEAERNKFKENQQQEGQKKDDINNGPTYEDIYDQIYENEVNDVPIDELYDNIDIPNPRPNSFNNVSLKRRDPKKGANAKRRANYMCEYEGVQPKCIGKNGMPYTEAHHLIPISVQDKFIYSLDVEANIVSLCSNCHATLHHGTFEAKKPILEKLYNDRKERLKSCYIYIELEDLFNIYR